ncbi:DUF968 domain-containing protein [Acidocella sp.]|uniref:DUF968 domain-containing protein n=1 Tax=Acidocella sp. TaxID=50710 RepID=UPI003FD84051
MAKQPCLICGRSPTDAHHLRFTQHRALGRKVSDEFTVPLCRGHHREVRRSGNEAAWWKKARIDPTGTARALWLRTHPLPTPPDKTGHRRRDPDRAGAAPCLSPPDRAFMTRSPQRKKDLYQNRLPSESAAALCRNQWPFCVGLRTLAAFGRLLPLPAPPAPADTFQVPGWPPSALAALVLPDWPG